MAAQTDSDTQTSNAYNLFILVLTVLSLAIMVLLLLPLGDATIQLLTVYDNVICVIFLFDFLLHLRRASTKRDYLIGDRGWLDLLGSIPALGVFRFTALLRLARLARSHGSPACCAARTSTSWFRTSSTIADSTPRSSRFSRP